MLFSNIEIKGHSGCYIKVIDQNKELLLTKGTNNPDYVIRLKKQAEKQGLFFSSGFKKIRTPEIINLEQSQSSCVITMKYIHAQNFVEFFDHAGYEKIDHFTQQVIQFLDWEILKSDTVCISDSILKNKYVSVKENILKSFSDVKAIRTILTKSEKIFDQTTDIYLPISQCHGDFTLSNILFNGDRLFVIDFLDSFVESPLIDMVKIRQDTAFGWSYLMYGNTFDRTRHQITLEWIDRNLDDYFSRYDWYNNHYGTFQLMNFLRILQYAHQTDVIDYLINKINLILDNYEF